jgi:hypothetical protein
MCCRRRGVAGVVVFGVGRRRFLLASASSLDFSRRGAALRFLVIGLFGRLGELQPTSVSLRTRTEMVLETSVLSTFNHLTRLEARENFINEK